MRYAHVCLESFGYCLPDEVVTSDELEARLAPVYARFGVHAGRLAMMSGIRARRFWPAGMPPSAGSTEAGRRALAAAGALPAEIECLLHTSVSRDFLEPATASVVHDNLSLSPRAMVYDISNACLGFMNGMLSLANMIELGQVRRGLIVACESGRQLVETTIERLRSAKDLSRRQFKAAFASLTIGAGACAVVMAHASVSQTGHRLVGGTVRSATEHNGLCRGSADTGFAGDAAMHMSTQAETLLVRGCALAREAWGCFKDAVGWTDERVDRTFCHQVGSAHRDRLYEALGLDVGLDFSTFPFLGNVGAVSVPLTAALGLERRPAVAGERMAMLGIGSGLNTVMLGVEW
ncbi:MAG: 3-oxoacyl-ACP synthase III [Phycisphaerae bacterium]